MAMGPWAPQVEHHEIWEVFWNTWDMGLFKGLQYLQWCFSMVLQAPYESSFFGGDWLKSGCSATELQHPKLLDQAPALRARTRKNRCIRFSCRHPHLRPTDIPWDIQWDVAKWKSYGDRNVAFRNIVEHRSWSWRELFTANVLLHIKHWNDNKPTMTTHCSRAALKNKEKTYFSQPLQWLPPKKRQARWLGSLYQAVVYGIAFVH